MNDNPTPPSGDVISFRLEGVVAEEVAWMAEHEGLSRSEVLRRMLLASFQSDGRVTVRCLRELGAIQGRLEKMVELLEGAEAQDAAEEVEGAVTSIAAAIDELEEFEEDDE